MTAKFYQPLCSTNSPDIVAMSSLQYIAASIFTANLLFLSTFFGRVGQSIKHPYIFCITILDSMKLTFELDWSVHGEMTLEDMLKHYELYKSMYLDQKEYQQVPSQRRNTT